MSKKRSVGILLLCLVPILSYGDRSSAELAMNRAVRYFLDRVNEEEIWVRPPARSRRITGHEMVDQRYREVPVEVPVFRMERREVLVPRRPDSGGEAAGLERRTVEVPGKQTGTRMETRLVRDPQGSVVRRERRPVYDTGGPDEWRLGQLGQNAMIATALLRSGHPDAAGAVAPMLDYFSGLLRVNGLPDATVDLAWIAVLFSESGDPIYQAFVPDMLAKLLMAQVREGPGKGLWGPMAVNTPLLAAHWQRYTAYSLMYQELVARFGADTVRATERRRLDEALANMERARIELKAYSWSHSRPGANWAWIELEDPLTQEPIRMWRPPEYLFNQISVDLDSTWLVLYAVRTAKDHGLFPAAFPAFPSPPDGTGRGTPRIQAPQPTSARQILLDTAQALQRNRHASGAFPEMNLHQPVRAFDGIDLLPGVPLPANLSFPELASPVTLVSIAQGYSAMVQLGEILGLEVLRPHAEAMIQARGLLENQLDAALAGDRILTGGKDLGWMNLALPLLDPGPDMPNAARNLRADFAAHLLRQQSRDSTWSPSQHSDVWIPSVTRARILSLPSSAHDTRMFDHAQAFTPFPLLEGNSTHNRARLIERYGLAQPVMSTAAAVLLLAEELRGHRESESEAL
ncbi:MAG: hypothetical protein JJU05_17950 [Verrucomicrobia bacterium]|nr:hypothetical protein [Verrucomicrobiota bacterium]